MCFRDLNLQNINRVHGQLTAIKGGNEIYRARPWGLKPFLPLSTFISQNSTRGKGGPKGNFGGNFKVNEMNHFLFPLGQVCRTLEMALPRPGFLLIHILFDSIRAAEKERLSLDPQQLEHQERFLIHLLSFICKYDNYWVWISSIA